MNVSMIVIGDEILNGRTQDKNAAWLSKYLLKKGMNLTSVRFIRDNNSEIKANLKLCLNENDVVITSGGIGPTIDDKTKNTLANFFGKKISKNEAVKILVEKNYERFGRTWNPDLNHYHFFPEDFIATNNPLGLAPGIVFYDEKECKLVMSAPGVPREFTEMVDLEFFPLIKKYFQNRLIENRQTVIRTEGIPEEKIFNELCPSLWQDLEKFGKVSSLPHIIGIDIIVSYEGSKNYDQEIKKIIEQSKLFDHVWSWTNETLPQLVLNTALEKKVTFSFAESCTGGLTSSKITDLAGSSKVFNGTVISYAYSAKENLLDVSHETLIKYGAVSEQTAMEMANGARIKLETDIALSLTGIAGPDGGTSDKPIGTVCIGFSTKEKSGAKTFIMPGDRLSRKDRFSERALLELLKILEKDF